MRMLVRICCTWNLYDNLQPWFDKLTMSGTEPLTLSPSKGRPELVEGSS